jgi:amino acid transporter
VVVVVIGLALAIWLGLQYDPITGLSIMVVASTGLYIAIYILVNLACVAYFLRYRRAEFNWLKHLVLPVAGAAVFAPVLLAELGIPAFSFISKLQAPLIYGAYAAVAIVVVAVAAACIIAVTRPARLSRLGAAFDEANQGGPVSADAGPRPPGLPGTGPLTSDGA